MLIDSAKHALVSKAPNCRKIRRLASQAIWCDLNARWKAFATATEQAAANGNSRKLFKLMKGASCQKPPICETLLDRDGNVITAREKLSLRWREHFLELLNHDTAPVTADFPTGNGDSLPYDCNLDVPTVAEIEAVVRSLKNGKTAGEDGLPRRCSNEASRRYIHGCSASSREFGNQKKSPLTGERRFYYLSSKKGTNGCAPNTAASASSTPRPRSSSRLCYGRFQAARDRRTCPTQSGLRPGRSCVDHIFNLRRALEIRHSYQQPMKVRF